jgi:hypothetical protein
MPQTTVLRIVAQRRGWARVFGPFVRGRSLVFVPPDKFSFATLRVLSVFLEFAELASQHILQLTMILPRSPSSNLVSRICGLGSEKLVELGWSKCVPKVLRYLGTYRFFAPGPCLHHTLCHQSLLLGSPGWYAGDMRRIVLVPGTETDQGMKVVGTCPGNCFYSPRIEPTSHAPGPGLVVGAPTIPLYMNFASAPHHTSLPFQFLSFTNTASRRPGN